MELIIFKIYDAKSFSSRIWIGDGGEFRGKLVVCPHIWTKLGTGTDSPEFTLEM